METKLITKMSYKIMFHDDKFHEISFLKKYCTLYSLLKDRATRKTTVSIANIDQTSFITNLMHGYNEGVLIIKHRWV